jgi:3-oxoacyl-[acyl-carrier-protein] synthase-3
VAFFQTNGVSIVAISACVPSNEVANNQYPYHTDLENKQFIQTTGIERRRIINNQQTASDLCFFSAEKILNELASDRSQIQVLIFVSQTPDYTIPCTATILQDRLGLPKSTLAFDINLGCSGYVYGLSVISSLLEKIGGLALLLVGDASSTCINQKDKSTAPLFSDAGSATLLKKDNNARPFLFHLQSDGAGFDAIISQDGGARHPIQEASFLLDSTTGRRPIDMHLDGIRVFNFSRKEVVPNVQELLAHFSYNKDSVDYFVFHQANKLMNDTIAKKLDLPESKVPQSLKLLGNTGAASIPVTIVNNLKANLHLQNATTVLAGFGVGLSWGSCIIPFQDAQIFSLLEV